MVFPIRMVAGFGPHLGPVHIPACWGGGRFGIHDSGFFPTLMLDSFGMSIHHVTDYVCMQVCVVCMCASGRACFRCVYVYICGVHICIRVCACVLMCMCM